jgi:hypothetical protein
MFYFSILAFPTNGHMTPTGAEEGSCFVHRGESWCSGLGHFSLCPWITWHWANHLTSLSLIYLPINKDTVQFLVYRKDKAKSLVDIRCSANVRDSDDCCLFQAREQERRLKVPEPSALKSVEYNHMMVVFKNLSVTNYKQPSSRY